MISTIFMGVFMLVQLAEIIAIAYRYGDLKILVVLFFGLCMIISGLYLIANGY